MDLARLEALLAAYGADPARWPDDERDAALALLARSAEARALRDAAARLDAALDAVPAPEPPSADLVARVLAAAPAAPAERGWPWAAAAASLAAAAALSLWLQGTTPTVEAPDVAGLGAWAAPTDVLLAAPAGDWLWEAPDLGCDETEIGCPELDVAPAAQSGVTDERDIA